MYSRLGTVRDAEVKAVAFGVEAKKMFQDRISWRCRQKMPFTEHNFPCWVRISRMAIRLHSSSIIIFFAQRWDHT